MVANRSHLLMAIQVLYLGRTAQTLERLLAGVDSSHSVSVSAVSTVEAAINWLPSGKPDCLVWDIDCEADPAIERLFSIAPGLPVVIHDVRSPPTCLDVYAPLVTHAEGETLLEAVHSVSEPRETNPSPPEVLLSLLDRSADRIARVDREGTYRSVSDGLAALLESPQSALVGSSVSASALHDPATILEHGRQSIDSGKIRRHSDDVYQYVFVPVGNEQFQLVVQDSDSSTDSNRVEPTSEFIDTVLDRLTDIFFVFDLQGRFLHWNDRLTEVTGYTDDEISSMTPMDFFVQEDYEQVNDAISKIVEDGSATEIVRIKTRGGRLLPYEFTGSMVTFDDGSPRYVCGVARDVSQRHHSERALRERQQALSNLIRNLPGVVYRYQNEPGFPVEFMSEGCTDLTGYERSRLESGSVSWANDVIHPEDREDVRRAVREALENGTPYQTSYRINTAEDGVRWVWEQGRGVDDPDGSVEYLDGYLTEITDIVEIEEKLRREKAFTDSALDAQTDIFYVFAPDGSILRWNDRFNEATGYTDEEIESMHTIDFVEADDVPTVLDAIDRVTTQREPVSIEATLVSKGGSHTPYEFTGSVIDDIGDRIYDTTNHDIYICGTGRDISQRITAERQRKEAINKLERSNDELERFAYVASHDLKEPLRMIRSYLDLIERRYEGELDDDADEFISYAVDGAERMRKMIDDLLTYSRIGTDDITVQSIDCNAVLDRVLESLQISIEETDAEIRVESLPTIEGDPQQLGQLFQNLISNAIAYSGERPPEIRIVTTDLDDEWRFSISDNGVGIEPEQRDAVFEIFSSGAVSQSTGIGLAVCQKIVHRHGGRIWVDSEPNIGSTFYFVIPKTVPTRTDSTADPLDV